MLCILYVIAVGTMLGSVGLLVERALPATAARRWVWCLVIPISAFLPGLYRTQHNVSVFDVLGPQPVSAPAGYTVESLGVLDAAWWSSLDSYNTIINRGWLIASSLVLIWGLASALRVALALRSSRQRQKIDGVPVVVTDSLGPATVGLWRSSVLVPRWVLSLPGVQRQYVVRHEDEHRKAHDAALLFAASLLLVLMPWNLALWWQLRRLRLAVEMDCDNRVVSSLGNANAYGQLLLTVAQAASRGPRLQPALLGGVGMLEKRLTAMLAPTPLRHVQRFLVPAAAIALFFIVISMPHPISGAESAKHGAHPAPTAEVTVSQK